MKGFNFNMQGTRLFFLTIAVTNSTNYFQYMETNTYMQSVGILFYLWFRYFCVNDGITDM
jgi:hypothetical protein